MNLFFRISQVPARDDNIQGIFSESAEEDEIELSFTLFFPTSEEATLTKLATMPPKNKKKAEEQKKKIIEDKTFGLKNKKKSKKVQNYVETVKKQATQKVEGPRKRTAGTAGSSSANTARLAQMAARLAELDLMNQPVKEKEKKLSAEELERKRREEEEEAERIRIANLPVEEQIEEERVKLKTRTPVTLDLFLQWKAEKDKERAERIEAEKTAMLKKLSRSERSRGQGLTGRELFQSNADLFVDDEGADDTAYKATSEYIGENDDDGDDDNDDKDDASVDGDNELSAPVDASLFGGAPEGEPPHSESVAIGDESLFT